MSISPANNRLYEGLYRTKRYGKWKPFSVSIANVELKDFEIKRRLIFAIKDTEHWNEEEGVEIVELKY